MGIAALGVVDLQAHALQLVAELVNLYVGGILFQYDDHTANLLYRYGREGPPLRGLQYGTSVS
mgnify:CR=1 FL=1